MKLIAGNWKMNLSLSQSEQLAKKISEYDNRNNIIVVFPPFTHLAGISETLRNTNILYGAQDCHYENKGAFTGDISPVMVRELGCRYVIVGHSERRNYHFESDEIINKKAVAALSSNLIPIICVGEKLEEREAKKHKEIVEKQINIVTRNLDREYVIAYEPVWAIGTGKTATSSEISEMHEFIRTLDKNKILYGGSVNEKNYQEILNIQNVDGLLIGGASLEIEKFSRIMNF